MKQTREPRTRLTQRSKNQVNGERRVFLTDGSETQDTDRQNNEFKIRSYTFC